MRNHYGVWVLVVLILTWFIPSSVLAQDQNLIEGVHYMRMKCPDGSAKTCIKLINKRGDQVDAESLANLFGISAFQLRAQNPTSTIAVCRDQFRRSVWHMARIDKAQDRATDIVWNNCPEGDRRVVTVPGESFEVSVQNVPMFSEFESAFHAAQSCGTNRACIRGKFNTAFADNPTTPSAGPVSGPPPAAPVPPNANLPTSVKAAPPLNPSTAKIAVDPSPPHHAVATTDQSLNIGILIWALAATLTVLFLLLARRRQQERFTNQAALHEERVELLDKANRERADLEVKITQLNCLLGESREANQTAQRDHQQVLQEKVNTIDTLTTQHQAGLNVINFVIRTFGLELERDRETGLPSAASLIKEIDIKFIDEILRCQTSLYGALPEGRSYPRKRSDAWSSIQQAEQEWQTEFQTRVQQIFELLTGKDSSDHSKKDVTGYRPLDGIRQEIGFLLSVVKDELDKLDPDQVQSQYLDLTSVMGVFFRVYSKLDERTRKAEQIAEDSRQSLRGVLKKNTHSIEESDDDSGPASKPPGTLPGNSPPSNSSMKKTLSGGTSAPTTESGEGEAKGSSPIASPIYLVSSNGRGND